MLIESIAPAFEQPHQETISFLKDWRDIAFFNPDATIKIGTMFSGIGAVEYALKRLNLKSEIQFASDIDRFAKQSYLANYDMDESHWFDDVHDIDGKKYKGKLSSGEIGLPMTGSSLVLPCGIYGRWES